MINVLLGDGDPKSRFQMRHTLVGGWNLAVAEVDAGVAAVERLTDSSFGLLVLDVGLSQLSGVEVLEVVRSETRLASLPVVMTGAEIEREQLHRIMELGVDDLIVKPFHPARLTARLGKVIDRMTAAASSGPPVSVTVKQGASVLVVDGSGAYRQLLQTSLGDRFRSTGLAAGTDALRVCADARPDVVVIGQDTGLLRGALLARKLRALPGCESTTVIALVPSGDQAESGLHDPVFQSAIVRSNDIEHLRRQLDRALGQQAVSARLQNDLRALHQHLVATIPEVFEILIGCRARVTPVSQVEGTHCEAMDLGVAQAGTVLRCSVHAEVEALRTLADWLGLTESVAGDGQGSDQMGEYLNLLAGGLRNWLLDHGYATERHLAAGEPFPESAGTPLRVALQREGASASLFVHLSIAYE